MAYLGAIHIMFLAAVTSIGRVTVKQSIPVDTMAELGYIYIYIKNDENRCIEPVNPERSCV